MLLVAVQVAVSLAKTELSILEVALHKEKERISVYPFDLLLLDAAGQVYFGVRAAISAILSNEHGDLLDDMAALEAQPSAKPVSLIGRVQRFAERLVLGGASSDGDADLLVVLPESTLAALSSPTRMQKFNGSVFAYDWAEERLPKKNLRNVLVTAALPYVNNVPHLGNVIGAPLSADVFARYCRQRGYQTLYVCGTDEYGTATETKALSSGLSCEELCRKYFAVHAATYDWFDIGFDRFGRTSTALQTEITHEIFEALYAQGYFEEGEVSQCWCSRCCRFLADRFVEGTCPKCGYLDARGDQCDGCGQLVPHPTDLLNARCKLCSSTPEVRVSKHLFLDLRRLQPAVEAWVLQQSVEGNWDANATSIAKAWLAEGLQPRCMTRDLHWGTSVPVPGYEKKVFYVWFDAPIGYISITAGYSPNWRQWWNKDEAEDTGKDVQLYQFMGKDNVPFHTVIFPSTLIGTAPSESPKDSLAAPDLAEKTKWTLLHRISTTEYLNYETGKFSKSRGVGVFGTDARDTGIPSSVWRYYLLATRPEHTDTAFSWADFAAKTNNELIANLGNLTARVVKFACSKWDDATVPESGEVSDLERRLEERVNQQISIFLETMEAVQLRAALKAAMSISALGNQYLSDSSLSNSLFQKEPLRCARVIQTALSLLALLAGSLLDPLLPSTAAQMRELLNIPAFTITDSWQCDLLEQGHQLSQAPFKHLFTPLDEKRIAELRAKFQGTQVQ